MSTAASDGSEKLEGGGSASAVPDLEGVRAGSSPPPLGDRLTHGHAS